MELLRQKVKEHKSILIDHQKEAIKYNYPNAELADKISGHPYVFAYFNYPEQRKAVDLNSFVQNESKKIDLIKNIEIPLEINSILQIIIDTDPRANQKKLALKNEKEILNISNSLLAAINLIRETDKHFYNDVVDNIKMIALFDSAYPHNFTINKVYNAIFFSPPNDASLIFYVDSLLHESSHNNLNLAFHKIEDFFTIDPFEKVFSSPFRKKNYKRGLFHVIHALFVVANLCNFYDLFYQKLRLTANHNEILGRLLTNIKFLNLSIDEIDFEPFYKKDGLALLEYFKETDKKMQDKYQHLVEKYILPNDCDNHIFSLAEFEKLNNL